MMYLVELSSFRNYLDQLPERQILLKKIQETLLGQPESGDLVR